MAPLTFYVGRLDTMGIGIVIYRSSPISLEEWHAVVASDASLRDRGQPYAATNPKSGELLNIAASEADAEIQVSGEWIPLLRWRRGALVAEYRAEFEAPSNPVRLKLSEVARRLNAVLGTDAGDEALNW